MDSPVRQACVRTASAATHTTISMPIRKPADEPENSRLVEVMDMRFGSPLSPAFVAAAVVDSRLRVLRTWFQFGVIRPR